MKKINWDLSAFYKNISDPKITSDKKEIEKLATQLTKKYKGKINSKKLTSKFLLSALNDYQNLLEKLLILENYAALIFSTDSTDEKIKSFYQEISEFYSNITTTLVWIDLEIIALDEKIYQKLIKDKSLGIFTHFLKQLRVTKPYTLSESEEKIMNQKSQTSSQALVRLYDQTESDEKFELEINGKKEILNQSQIGSIMKSHPDRKLRQKAIESYSITFTKNSKLYSYILNTLILDKKITDEIRGFKYPQEATLISYEINLETVENMSKVIFANQKLVEKYYLKKASLTKSKKLYDWDRYSNIYSVEEKKYTWEDAKKIILDCFKEFSPIFYTTAKLFYDNSWIDADIHQGKRSGAYCSFNVPSLHPVVFVNFSGKLEDVTTLAHELGHAIHAYLARKNGLLEYHSSTAVAEIASTFCECLVFEKLLSEIKDKKLKINLLGNKIQNEFATVFRQNDFYKFESILHEKRRTEGELSEDFIGDTYQALLQKTFGKGLTLSKYHKSMWMPILHFYHYNFYVFTYCFGDLLALSLFNLYKKEGQKFVDAYTKGLEAGGSKDPYEITRIMGVDIKDPSFWKNGLLAIEKEVKEFVELAS